ncbi:hypothetical protein JHK82_051415 [Glycine max]|nr:hypothetical protein JHK82_051415 [Glycine max]
MVGKLLARDGFAELVFRLFETLREDKLKECCMVFWSLWHARNERLWEELDVPATQIILRAKETFTQ